MNKTFLGVEAIRDLRYAEHREALFVATKFGSDLLLAHSESYPGYHSSLVFDLRFDYVAVLQMLIKDRPELLEHAYVKWRLKG